MKTRGFVLAGKLVSRLKVRSCSGCRVIARDREEGISEAATLQTPMFPANMPRIVKRPVTTREEANALTCIAFRNGYLEELHAGRHSEILDEPGYSRITDAEMKKLMIGASTQVARLLELKENNPAEYWRQIMYFNENVCARWEK